MTERKEVASKMNKQRHKSTDKEVHAEPEGINDEEAQRDDKRTKLRERERQNESVLQKAIMSWTKNTSRII